MLLYQTHYCCHRSFIWFPHLNISAQPESHLADEFPECSHKIQYIVVRPISQYGSVMAGGNLHQLSLTHRTLLIMYQFIFQRCY